MNDYIKREDAITALEEWAVNLIYPKFIVKEDAICALKDVPNADVVEVRHGRWTGKTYKCSLCGKWVDPLQGDADMNYCPNCGAKMDGEEQENEHTD